MSIAGGIVVYLLIWWLVFFCMLPIGVNRTAEESERDGHDPGAPRRPRLLMKFAVTTGISAVLWGVAWWFITTDIVSFQAPA